MNSEDFVDDYISNCIELNIKKPKDICEFALKEMQEIDEKLRESNLLRIRYKNLKLVLKNFDHESLKRIKTNQILNYSEIDDMKDSIYYNMLIDICNFIDNSKTILTSREIMDVVGSRENSEEIFACIKILSENGIISRNEARHILKGPSWDERPKNPLVNSV